MLWRMDSKLCLILMISKKIRINLMVKATKEVVLQEIQLVKETSLLMLKLIHFNPKSFDAWDQPAFLMSFGFSIFLGFFINYGATWTVEQNDALTLAVAGSTKSAVMGLVVCAGLFDRTYKFSWWNFIGLQVSACASFAYVYFATQQQTKPAKPQMAPV